MSDLFDFFKENEHKLQEKPPEKVWLNLEQRLNKARKKPKKIQFLQPLQVVLVVLILVFAAVLVWYFTHK